MKETIEEADIGKGPIITRRSIVYGSIVGVLYIFLAVYVSLTTGMVLIGGIPILGYILLSVRGKYNPRENVVLSSIVDGTVCISAALVAGLPALVMFKDRVLYNTPITLQLIFTIAIFGGVLGLFLLLPFRESFLKLPWPQLVPLYQTIESLGTETAAKNRLLKGMGISAVYVGGILSYGYVSLSDLRMLPPTATLPNWWTSLMYFDKKALDLSLYTLNPNVYTSNLNLYNNLSNIQSNVQLFGQAMSPSPLPSFMGISNSPLIASVGYFVGWKRAAMIFLGGVYSVLVWMLFENQPWQGKFVNYGSHVNLPQIFYLAMGVLIASLFWSFTKGIRDWFSNRKKMKLLKAQIESQMEYQESQQKSEDSKTSTALTPVPKPSEEAKQIKQKRVIIRDLLHLAITRYKTLFIVLAIFLIGSSLLFYVFQPFDYFKIDPFYIKINPLFMGISAALLPISSWWTALVLGETGFMSGFLTDLLAVPGILGFDLNFSSLIVFFTLMTVMQSSAIRVIGWFKVGREFKVKDRTILKSVLYGVLFGAVVGSVIIFLLYQTYGFGNSFFPAPTAAITGILFLSILQFKQLVVPSSVNLVTQSLGQFQYYDQFYQYFFQPYSRYYTAIFFIIGLIVGLALSKVNLSPISFLIGVLIPPAYSFTVMLGGVLNYYVYRRNRKNPKEYAEKESKNQQYLSGAIAGEGLVYLVWIGATTLMMFFGL